MERQARIELQRWMVQLADGDRAAFRPVFDLAWPQARAVAARVMREPADAEDAAQAALLSVFERASEYDGARDALAWIVGIVSWECMTLRRKRTRRREAGGAELATVADAARDPEAATAAAELEAVAVAVMGQLAAEDRETLRCAFFGGEGRAEVAPATFRKRVQRALARLRAAWRQHGIG